MIDIFTDKILELPVLDKGFVKVIDILPRMIPDNYTADYVVVEAARVSTQKGLKSPEEDKKLLTYLYENQHDTPFEMAVCRLHIKCPIFVERHIFRHRTASVNSQSGRYSKIKNEYYVPKIFKSQSKSNKQKSDEPINEVDQYKCNEILDNMSSQAFIAYEELLRFVSREQARMILPLNTYTEFFMQMNLRNLLHFLDLRLDSHAQDETQEYAFAIYTLVKQFFPWTFELFDRDLCSENQDK